MTIENTDPINLTWDGYKKKTVLPLPLIVAIYIVIQSAFPVMERIIYHGEFVSALIILYYTRFSYIVPNSRLKKNIVAICIYFALFLPAMGLVIGYLSSNHFQLKFAVRHLSYYLPIFFFIYAYFNSYRLLRIFENFSKVIILLIPFSFVYGQNTMGFASLLSVFFISISNKSIIKKNFLLFGVMLALLIPIFKKSSSHYVFFALLLITILWGKINPKTIKKKIITSLMICVMIVSSFLVNIYISKHYSFSNYRNFNKLQYDLHYISDENILWRLAYWGILLEQIPQNLCGVGIGTPICDKKNISFLSKGRAENIHISEYVLAAHNFLVTYSVRNGLFFIIPILIIFFYFFNQYQYINYRIFVCRDSTLFILFFSSMLFFVEALFNVVLESPLYSYLFWFYLGLFLGYYTNTSLSSQS